MGVKPRRGSEWTPALCIFVGACALLFGWGNPFLMIAGGFLILLGLAVDVDRAYAKSVEASDRYRRRR
jgi:hypothetical protein